MKLPIDVGGTKICKSLSIFIHCSTPMLSHCSVEKCVIGSDFSIHVTQMILMSWYGVQSTSFSSC